LDRLRWEHATSGGLPVASKKRKGIGFALFLIGLGVLLVLENLDVLPGDVLDYWPIVFIAWGLSEVYKAFRESTD
jgi:hypothetical protein